MAAAFAADAFEALLLAGFSAKKLLRGSGNGEPLGDPESILTAIRPRSAPSFDCELVSAPDEVDASIIIPAYNAEAYLEECLDSAIAQVTNYRYEIVVVDDGSCDGTRRILCDYRDRHDLTVVRTANGGVAAARNTAIAVARGKYLLFLDSDDRLPADSVDLLISAAEREGADIVQGGHDVFDTSGRVIEQVRRAACTQSTLDENSTQISGYPWGKAVRRTMFRQVRFPDGMDFEDTIFALVILPLCGRYVSLRESVYNYRDNPSGVTQKVVGTPSALDAYWIVPVLLEQRGRLNLPVDENLLNRVQKQFGHLLWARVAGHDDRVRRAAFAAACGVVHNVRSQVVPTSNKPESPKLDFIFRERRYDLWSYAGKYGLL
ncbi:glycosyltransferase family 2 protein [Mycolicibacterium fluoranthenivorans]|nr:glycosyltransferase family 2 protein [Mycolicibacterium fluoranthenivorans]